MTQSAPARPIDTKAVKNRPDLRFASVEEVVAYASRLAAAERAGTLVRLGNWTLGECFSHLAAFATYALDGYPPGLTPPLALKLVLRLFKRKMMNGRLPAGFRIPGAPGGTIGVVDLPTDEGLRRLEAAMLRLKGNAPIEPNPIFGPLSHGEWLTLQYRHAELHLSFYRVV